LKTTIEKDLVLANRFFKTFILEIGPLNQVRVLY